MELDLSFSAAEKKNGSAYTLEIEELPMLEVPPKPAKPGEGEGASTRQSSPAPSSATKSMQEDPAKAVSNLSLCADIALHGYRLLPAGQQQYKAHNGPSR